jgi:hypothetical protein
MVATRIVRPGQRRTIGRSAAGVPRTYRTSSIIGVGQASGCTTETPDAMMSNQPLPGQATEVPALVGKVARLCGGLLNSVRAYDRHVWRGHRQNALLASPSSLATSAKTS